MVRIADPIVTEKLAEVTERVERGEHVVVELANGKAFLAAPVAATMDASENLGSSLRNLRAQIEASGVPLLTWDEIDREIAELRGERIGGLDEDRLR